jgi:hypothetical protein
VLSHVTACPSFTLLPSRWFPDPSAATLLLPLLQEGKHSEKEATDYVEALSNVRPPSQLAAAFGGPRAAPLSRLCYWRVHSLPAGLVLLACTRMHLVCLTWAWVRTLGWDGVGANSLPAPTLC